MKRIWGKKENCGMKLYSHWPVAVTFHTTTSYMQDLQKILYFLFNIK